MKSKKSNLIWIILTIIVLLSGMCSGIQRTDSFLAFSQNDVQEDTIESVEKDNVYIGNCTNKLITGLRDTFQKSHRGFSGLSLRNYAEFLWIKEILQMLCSFCVAVVVAYLPILSSKTAILKFIHNQDGEK